MEPGALPVAPNMIMNVLENGELCREWLKLVTFPENEQIHSTLVKGPNIMLGYQNRPKVKDI